MLKLEFNKSGIEISFLYSLLDNNKRIDLENNFNEPIEIHKKFSFDSQFNVIIKPTEYLKTLFAQIYKIVNHESILLLY